MCRAEAERLSALKPQLDELGVPLYGILHEDVSGEPEEFQPFLGGEKLFLDREKTLFHRKGSLWDLASFTTLKRYAYDLSGTAGNMKGNGLLLGGVLVVGRGDDGVLWEHQEKFIGDTEYETADVITAAKRIAASAAL